MIVYSIVDHIPIQVQRSSKPPCQHTPTHNCKANPMDNGWSRQVPRCWVPQVYHHGDGFWMSSRIEDARVRQRSRVKHPIKRSMEQFHDWLVVSTLKYESVIVSEFNHPNVKNNWRVIEHQHLRNSSGIAFRLRIPKVDRQ